MNNASNALKELTKIFEQQDLINKSDSYLDDCEEKVCALFPQLSAAEYEGLHLWLNTGNTVARKINNYLMMFSWVGGEDGCNLGVIVSEEAFEREVVMFDWLNESIDACHQHIEECGAEWMVFVWGFVIKGQEHDTLLYRVMAKDPRPQIGLLVWDEKAFDTSDVFANAFTASLIEDPVHFQDGLPSDKLNTFKAEPLFKYHPVRYKQSREYVRSAPNILKSEGLQPSFLDMNAMNVISSLVSLEANKERSTVALRFRKDDKYNPIKVITQEIDCYTMYSPFVYSGKKIFDLNAPLVEMFRYTSVDAIPVSFITSPFKNYYLYFGKQEHLATGDGWHLDGVYVQHYPEAKLMQFMFTSCPEKPAQIARWVEGSEPVLKCSITDDLFDLNLGAAIEKVIETRRAEMLERIEKGDMDRTLELQNSASELGGDLSDLGVGTIIDIGATTAKARLAELEDSIGTLKAALSLAVNSVCYLTAYPDDIDLEWASETPRSLVERATKGHPNVKKNTESKLLSTGYQRVYLCGRKLTQGPADVSTEGAGSKRTHWRRFHWRLQPYGPKRSLRKAIIIEAMLINPGAGYEDEPTGTIYIDKNVIDLNAVKKKLGFSSKIYWDGLE